MTSRRPPSARCGLSRPSSTTSLRPLRLLVVPRHRVNAPLAEDPAPVAWLRGRQGEGDEIPLQGYEPHIVRPPRGTLEALRVRALTRGEGEFVNLDYAETSGRLRRARAVPEGCGLRASGFVAPGFLVAPAARRAVADARFPHVLQFSSLWEPPAGRTRFAPALVFDPHSALTRRLTTLYSCLVRRGLGRSPLLRLVVHPPDVGDPRTAAALGAVLPRLLRIRIPTTDRPVAAR